MLDRICYNPALNNHKIMYVNGDCTKWSAAETMSSFISMIYAFKEKITSKMFKALLATFNAWSNKRIQIPIDIYNKVIPDKTKKTNFLNEPNVRENAQILSTQNFLQGMFNYSSSYKAVCCTNYTYYIWKKIYPNSTLVLEHMEHSDDYVLIVLYNNNSEFEKFRILQKIMMRLHGYNDSDRKTSCQPFMMEFVSQISFNGVMLYPQIKKSKEINLSLPCTSYKIDMEAALSRIGECARYGCNQSFLYFFERLHVYLVAKTYSVIENKINSNSKNYKELLDTPIELFGIPDYHPMFSLYCKGNANNYRIYNYTENQNLIKKLYYLSYVNSAKNDVMIEDIDYQYSLQTPRFLYEIFNKSVKKLRDKLKITIEQIKEFWYDNISYKFLKPKNKESLITWIKCMFYNRTFLEAYSKTNRTMMTMRLSKYVRGKIIKPIITLEDFEKKRNVLKTETYTMLEYLKMMEEILNNENFYSEVSKDIPFYTDSNFHENQIRKIITKCDATYSGVYSILSNIDIGDILKQKDRITQIATKTPIKHKSISLVNPPSILLQYLYNKDNFLKDKKTLLSKESLDKDISEIKQRIDERILKNAHSTLGVLSVYNDLMINSEKRIVMFAHNRNLNNLIDYVVDTLSYNLLPGKIVNINYKNVATYIDPTTGGLLYQKGKRLVSDFYRQSTENICLLFIYYYKVLNFDLTTIKKELDENFLFHTVVNDKEYDLNYKQILNNITKDYLKIYNYNITEQKVVGFMKALLLDDYSVIDSIATSVYSYSYKYIIKDIPIGGEYRGTTLLQFTYLNTTVKVYYCKETYDNPILFVNKHYSKITPILYNIAIKTTKNMSEDLFEKTMTKIRYEEISGLDIKKIIEVCKKTTKIIGVVKKGVEIDNIVKVVNILDTEKYLPIFVTNEVLRRGGDIEISKENVRPLLNMKELSVMLGKSKLFTLPFWSCNQHENIKVVNKNKEYNNILITDLLQKGRLERYLFNKMNKNTDSYDNIIIDSKKIISNIMKDLKSRRIYNFKLPKDIILKSKTFKKIYEEDLRETELITNQTNYSEKHYFEKQKEEEDFLVSFENNPNNEDENEINKSEEEITLMPENNENDNTKESNTIDKLKDMAMKMTVDLEDMLLPEEIDDYVYDEELQLFSAEEVSYYGEELKTLLKFDKDSLNFGDFLVTKPTTKKNITTSTNYLLKKIACLPNLYTKQIKYKYGFSDISQSLNFQTYLNTLFKLDNYFSHNEEHNNYDDDEIIAIYLMLHEFLTNCYIKEQFKRDDFCFRIDKNNNFIICFWFNLTTEQLNKTIKTGQYLNEKTDDNKYLLKLSYEKYEKKLKQHDDYSFKQRKDIIVPKNLIRLLSNLKQKILSKNIEWKNI